MCVHLFPSLSSVGFQTLCFPLSYSPPIRAGQVIKGWDKGIASMKKGEKAVFTIAPEYAYGAAGSPPTIPANATLKFEVELLSWTSVKDICGDGGVFKKVLVEGKKWEMPKDLDEVTGEQNGNEV